MSEALQAAILTGLLSAICSSYVGWRVSKVQFEFISKAIDELKERLLTLERRRSR